MTAYIDPPAFVKPSGKKRYCHLTADSLPELHAFAAAMGLGKHFFHTGARHIHYDVPEDKRPAALQAGAVEVTSREMVRLARSCRALPGQQG